MAKTNDLEKRAKEIRDKLLTKEDKTNLVARVIIELIKQEKRKIAYKRVSCEIQEMFGLKKYKPWIVYWEGAMKSRLFDIIKLCHDEKKEIPISILVDNGTKNCRNGFCDGYEKNYGKKYNLENLEKDQEITIQKICKCEYDFLLKPIPYLENCKEYKTYQATKIINDEIDNRQDLTDEEKKQTKEYTYETRIPLGEMQGKILKRAEGKCECCKKGKKEEMTFEKENGENYLEIHHIKHYSDCKKEGINPHTYDNLAALCPKCHTKPTHLCRFCSIYQPTQPHLQ